MITVFNRIELFVTHSMAEQGTIRAKLAHAGIEYRIETVNLLSPTAFSRTRAFTGSLGHNAEHSYIYIFYVRSKDFESAEDAIKK